MMINRFLENILGDDPDVKEYLAGEAQRRGISEEAVVREVLLETIKNTNKEDQEAQA